MNIFLKSLVRSTLLSATFFLFSGSVWAQVATNQAFVVYADFENALANSTGNSPNENSLALFSGNEGAYSPPGSESTPVIPVSAEGVALVSSSFGQMFGRVVPFANFEVETIKLAQEKLGLRFFQLMKTESHKHRLFDHVGLFSYFKHRLKEYR
jgi:hypothetical protein